MYYYETNEKGGKTAGIAAAVIYLGLWLALMLLINFSFVREETGEGILINFGDTEEASGLLDPDHSDVIAEANTSPQAPDLPDEYLTQDFEEAPEIAQPDRPREQRPTESDTRDREPNPQPETPPQPVRQVNQQALFPGVTPGSNSTSEGTAATGVGNQGVQEGSPLGSHDGSGTGGGGTGFNLAGRSVVGVLPEPAYGANKEGRVIIEITVNPAGEVVNAAYHPNGSTTNDSSLVNAARRAALQSRFNRIEADGLQRGTITYNFKFRRE